MAGRSPGRAGARSCSGGPGDVAPRHLRRAGWRGRGVGHSLMAAAAAEAVRIGCVSLEWGVHTANAGALEFYRRLGAVGAEVRIMGVTGERLRALAKACDGGRE